MNHFFKCLLLINLIGVVFCRSLPLPEENLLGRPHHHRHRHHEEILSELETTEEEIRRLRLLDQLLGEVEEAAASNLDLEIRIPPEIEAEIMMLEDMRDDPENEPEDFRMIPLPQKFSRYDIDGNGFVTREELALATETSIEDSAGPFTRADINEDGLLTEIELYDAPWVFNLHNMKLGRVAE